MGKMGHNKLFLMTKSVKPYIICIHIHTCNAKKSPGQRKEVKTCLIVVWTAMIVPVLGWPICGVRLHSRFFVPNPFYLQLINNCTFQFWERFNSMVRLISILFPFFLKQTASSELTFPKSEQIYEIRILNIYLQWYMMLWRGRRW